ncbi:hypothetical protein FOXG_19990 [Fusarium oxysporum f. sp. lycopersici 4287]|uniref:Uncharacterized protein n=1 Tax=Fusarium oxysporum f. sp. lycopersici (strain 4287 / CBS 123668 / FGSC 9935 / NRRL 34936) TaxID=426428 RepID=A0A0J9WNZ0_FUSO4|nr:hypothetical protein FOXG_19990 [Fusarium oxysporum f. sp. lycopersici 4287]KNB08117.1 hypothetical protein FOXG_19990 [Fusarium oxysporum f. sp. lycopersici 4287]
MDTTMNYADPQSYSDFPWDSLIDTFPFLTNQAYQALSIQLEFFRNMGTMNLSLPEDASAKEKLKTILDKAKLVNELMSILTHSSELLIELKNMEFDEMVDARREEVSSMIDEAGENIEKVFTMQKEEVERGLRQKVAEPGLAEVQDQQRRTEQEKFLQQRISELGLGAPGPSETRIPVCASHQLTSRVICHNKALYHSKFQGFTMLLLHYQREIKDTIQYHYTTQFRHIARHQDMVNFQGMLKFQDMPGPSMPPPSNSLHTETR